MSCTLTWIINANEEALKGDVNLNSEFTSSLFAEYSCSFFVPIDVRVLANYHNNNSQEFARGSQVALNAEYSGSEFTVCGNEIISANPTFITVDNTTLDGSQTNFTIDHP